MDVIYVGESFSGKSVTDMDITEVGVMLIEKKRKLVEELLEIQTFWPKNLHEQAATKRERGELWIPSHQET